MRIAGVNILAVLLAAVAIYLVGFVIYGMLIDEAALLQMTGTTAEQHAALGTSRMAYGVVMPLMTAGFMAVLFNWASVSGLVNGVKWGTVIALASAVPTVWYGWVYGVWDCTVFLIDSGHLLLGHMVAGGILASWK